MSTLRRLIVLGGVLETLSVIGCASTGMHAAQPAHPYRYSVVDVPVSLAPGLARTPAFTPPKDWWYWILVQVEKPLPFRDMQCLTGVNAGTDLKGCVREPVLDAEWTVLEDGQVVTHGSSVGSAAAIFTNENIFRFLGGFPTKRGRTYVVDVTFVRDGTPLDIANPHLIVVRQGLE